MLFLDRLRNLLSDLRSIQVQDDSDNAEAIEALKSAVIDLAVCLGDYISEKE